MEWLVCVAALEIAVESPSKGLSGNTKRKLHRRMDGGESGWVVKKLLSRGTKAS
jgi:hypothetical protein